MATLLAVCGPKHPEQAPSEQAKRLTVWGHCLAPCRTVCSHLPTLTPASQRREQQDCTREGKQKERAFTFLNKVQNPADSNQTTVQLLSLLTQTNLRNTHEASHEVWLVNMNYSTVDLTLTDEVKSEVSLPHSGGSVNYKMRHVRDESSAASIQITFSSKKDFTFCMSA